MQLNYLGPFSKKSAFSGKQSHPLLLDLLLLKEFGHEYLGWEPETCWQEIEKTFGTNVSEVNKNKIQAVKTCHITDRPYDAWNIFEKVALSLSGTIPIFSMIQKPTPHVCAAALETMAHIKKLKPSKEIYRYISAVLLDDGIAYGPGSLEPCNPLIREKVGGPLQDKIGRLVREGARPRFDGSDDQDIQLYKSLSIADYVHYDSKKLLEQTNVLFKERSK